MNFLQMHQIHFLTIGSGPFILLLLFSLLIAKIRHMRYCKEYELNAYRRNLTASLAHDLKSPLMAISGYAENLRDNVHTEKRAAYADSILQNTQYMDRLIADVLDLAKLEQGTVLQKRSCDLAALANETAAQFRAQTEERHLTVTVSGTDDETAHIWNAIVLDDDWYYTDVTWDDTDELHMYDYFNVTSDELFKTHEASPLITEFDDTQLFSSDGTITTFNLFIPECTAEKYNYYRYSGSVYGGAENNTLEEDLKRVADKNEPYFHIVIDTDKLSFEDAYEELFSEDSYTFADYIDRANASISENKLSTSVSIYKKKDLNTITIQLKYS
jgi:hypothetical protein